MDGVYMYNWFTYSTAEIITTTYINSTSIKLFKMENKRISYVLILLVFLIQSHWEKLNCLTLNENSIKTGKIWTSASMEVIEWENGCVKHIEKAELLLHHWSGGWAEFPVFQLGTEGWKPCLSHLYLNVLCTLGWY